MNEPEAGIAAELNSVDKSVLGASGMPMDIVSHLDLTIRSGEFVALIGPSGSGKSTLLNLLGLLDRPSRGTYCLAGVNVTTASEKTLTRFRAQHLSFIFQAFHLAAEKTVMENVEIALACQGVGRSERRRRAEEMLCAVGLEERMYAYPATLSGGEQQRTAVARALARTSTLILADEPTGNLDATNADAVLRLISGSLRRDSAVVMVTHDPAIAARADRLVRLEAGRIVPSPQAAGDR